MGYSVTERQILQSKTEFTGVHPQKFALWLAMASMSMFFAALTSALLVKKGDFRYWEAFTLPRIFLFSTITVVGISAAMQFSLSSYRKSNFFAFRIMLGVAFVLSLLFLALQLKGWNVLMQMGMPLTGNLSGSFIYIITGSHAVHLILGLLLLVIFLIQAIRHRNDPLFELKNIINPKRQLNLELLVAYWHYVDAVWIYLYIFFYLNY